MTRILIVIAALLLFGGGAAEAHGKQVRFLGVHPIPKAEGGGICYIEGPHVHIYAAPDKLQYRDHAGANYFVGDPVAYGYDGPHYAYKGPHPIHVEAVVGDDQPDEEYCYIEGPHFHPFRIEGPDVKVVGDTTFFVGEPPKAFIEARPRYVGINAVYRPLVYTRPVVAVEAPDGWIGARVDLPAVIVDAPAVVVSPPVVVIPAPVIDVRIPAPSIHIGVGVDMGVGIGGGVIVDHGHHDNGRHLGERKHGR